MGILRIFGKIAQIVADVQSKDVEAAVKVAIGLIWEIFPVGGQYAADQVRQWLKLVNATEPGSEAGWRIAVTQGAEADFLEAAVKALVETAAHGD